MLIEVSFLLFGLLNIVVRGDLSASLAAPVLGDESLVHAVQGTLRPQSHD